MMTHVRVAVCLAAGLMAAASSVLRGLAEEASGPEGVKVVPVPATWEYIKDGTNVSHNPFPGPDSMGEPRHSKVRFPYAWKGTFEIADPASVAGLWIRMAEDGEDPRATLCNGDIVVASGGYWRDLGFTPTLLDAVITLNGRPVPFPHGGGLLQFWVPLVGEIRKGANTVEMSGNGFKYWGPLAKTLSAVIVSAEAQPAEFQNGPILGDFGDGYFTLCCRTRLPADVIVEATPAEPAGAAVTAVSTNKIWHRVKVEVPKGIRRLNYTVTSRLGAHELKRGPFPVTLPDSKAYRFIAFGHTQQQPVGKLESDPLYVNSQQVLKAKPDFVVNTGNLLQQGSWSFWWEKAYTVPAGDLLARVPTLITPCADDFTGIFNELHYTPSPDTYAHTWTKTIGPALFVGIDGNTDWSAGSQNAGWLDGVLAASKDKFIVVLCAYPGYSSGINSKKMFPARLNTRDVILPMLAKYKATLMLCSWDPTYERIDIPAPKGVTQIVTGAFGLIGGVWHRWDTRMGSHEFVPPEGNARATRGKVVLPSGVEWVGYFSMRHFVVFDVTEDAIEMKVLATAPTADVDTKDLRVIDQKTFKPRL